jgi:hypothetical protein
MFSPPLARLACRRPVYAPALMLHETKIDPMPKNEITTLLSRKQELDQRNEGALNMAPYDRWIADALEALLRTIDQKVVAPARKP